MASFRTGLAAILWLVTASPLFAEEKPDENCLDDDMNNRCEAVAQAAQRALYAAQPIEQLAETNMLLLRAFFVDGYGNDVGMAQLDRRPGEEPRILFTFPGLGAGKPRTLERIIDTSLLDTLVERSARFDATLPPEPLPEGVISVCLHSWVVTVEMIDEDGKIRRKTEDACSHELAVPLAFAMADTAVAADPACTAIDPEYTRNSVTRLGSCNMLAGDRQVAAIAWNGLEAANWLDPNNGEEASVRAKLKYDVELLWAGEELVKGWQPVLDRLKVASEGDWYVKAVTGLDHRTARADLEFAVLVDGGEDGEDHYLVAAAPVAIEISDNRATISRIEVGEASTISVD
ncbi:MAG: hypothetical protein KDD90_04030 [Sphingomonadaceae bacterium]|jgi:hypothetical protein|nr:hypothetical protein [Sphingomonadaceae bacterium]